MNDLEMDLASEIETDSLQPETTEVIDENIAATLDDIKLDEIAEVVTREFNIDETNFQSRKTKIEELYDLALQVVKEKDYPFPNASNIKYPIVTKAAINFNAMAYPSIVQDDKVVKAKILGNDDGGEVVKGADGNPLLNPATNLPMKQNEGLKQKIADRVASFMSYQILNIMDGWEDDMDKIMIINPIIGCSFKKVYHDSASGKNVSKLILPQFLVMNIDAQNVETAQRVTELLQLYPNEIEANIRMGIFLPFDYSISNETLDDNYKGREDITATTQDETLPHVFLEQHRWLDLDDDGYEEPYIVWLHKETNKVVRIIPRFEEDDVVYRDNKIARIEAQSQYVKYGFIPDPEGSPYDIGFGHLIQHLNETANTSINQMIDQGHRYTMGGGFIGDGLRMKSGLLKHKPGEYKRVKTNGMSIRENVVPLPMPEPSPVLMTLMEYIINGAEDIANMAKVMAGDIPPNMPATTALASIDQGMQSFKAIYKRIHRSLRKEFKRLFDLNGKYLSQDEYMRVLDDKGANVELDFSSENIDIFPVSDPNKLTSTQSFIKAQFLMGFMQDTLTNQIDLRKRIFGADGMNLKDPDDLIQMPAPPQPDILVQSQVAALEAQILTMKNDAKRKDKELMLKIEQAVVEMKHKLADTTKKIAEAEATEQGSQLEQYNAYLNAYELQMQNLNQLKEGLNETGNIGERLDTMENQQSDPAIL